MRKQRITRLPSNWRSRLEITRIDEPAITGRFCCLASTRFNLDFKKGRTPKGFGRHVGDLLVIKSVLPYVDGAEIDKYFRRRGLGRLLYVYALKEFGSLTTYYHSISFGAKQLWSSLLREYPHETDFFAGTLTIKKK